MALNRGQSTTSPNISKEQPLLSQHPYTTSSEIEVRNRAAYKHLSNQKSLRVPNMNSIVTARIHVSRLVTFDTVGHAAAAVGEQLPSKKLRTVVYDIVLVNRTREAWVVSEVASVARRTLSLYRAGIGDVHLLVVGAEAEAVALHEAVCDTPDLSRRGLEAVDLTWQLR
jgi:hypothetical protein